MPKKRKKKRPGRSKPLSRQTHKEQQLILFEYTVTYEPIKNKDLETLSAEVQKQVGKLFYMTNSNPKKVIPELRELIEEYPHIAVLYNYLGRAYSVLGDTKNANKIVFEAYQKFPNYLFARLNYAQICLEDGQLEEIPEIFDNKFELKLLYPERSEFHISEVLNFTYATGSYFARIGNKEAANSRYKFLKQIEPEHPLTKHFARLLAS